MVSARVVPVGVEGQPDGMQDPLCEEGEDGSGGGGLDMTGKRSETLGQTHGESLTKALSLQSSCVRREWPHCGDTSRA